jgi:uncharacterized protein YuzB (UPF0349 family)
MSYLNEGIGLVLIELCDYNQLSPEHLKKVTACPEVAVMSYDCLNRCGMCSMCPFAMVNGKQIFGRTIDACVEKIKHQVDDELRKLS